MQNFIDNQSIINATNAPQIHVFFKKKVMVMGTSVASSNAETTINTSTESASTLATNVTGTDTSTCDSLDLGMFQIKREYCIKFPNKLTGAMCVCGLRVK